MIDSILSVLPPAAIMIAGGLLLPFLNRPLRLAWVLLIPVLTLIQVWHIPKGEALLTLSVAGFDINPIYAHPYTHIFATVFSIAAFVGGLFGLTQSKVSEAASALIYAGGAIGVTFSGDFISLFIYWEIMAVGSTMVIFASDQGGAMRSGIRYALVHFLGGVILMAGIILHIMLSGDSTIVPLYADMAILFPKGYMFDMNGISVWLILIGVLINAAAPPMSAWLPDSYPKASAFGAVFLSAFTTKTSVFVLITVFAGTELLIYVGLFMIFYGIVYAMLENDMRKILSYSVINQVGFMVTGVGIGTELALNGAASHAFVHIIYKSLLFMYAGSILYMTGKSRCSDLSGLYCSMKLTAICGTIGVLTVAAFPLTAGFLTKSMISSAAMYEELKYVWLLLIAGSVGIYAWLLLIPAASGVSLSKGTKFPWFRLSRKDSGLSPEDPPLNMKLAMVLLSLLCIIPAIPGMAELTIYRMLPNPVDGYVAYKASKVISQSQLLIYSAIAFLVMLPMLKRTKTISLDFDWFYRVFARYFIVVVYTLVKFPARISVIVAKKIIKKGVKIVHYTHQPEGLLARSQPLSVTASWVLAMLGVYLIVYYL